MPISSPQRPAMDSSPDQQKAFLSRFSAMDQRLAKFRWRHDKATFGQLLSAFGALDRIRKIAERREAPHYNLFTVCHIWKLEAYTHTPFLVNLLDPQGSHGHGSLFYDRFLQRVLPKEAHRFAHSPYTRVMEEAAVPGLGRIDILIRNFQPENPFAIIIENKIYAVDQPDQLQRYHTIATQKFQLEASQIRLLYLSPDGKPPTEKSIKPEDLKDLADKNIYQAISYKKEISEWLQDCLPEVQAPKLRDILDQYLQTLQIL